MNGARGPVTIITTKVSLAPQEKRDRAQAPIIIINDEYQRVPNTPANRNK